MWKILVLLLDNEDQQGWKLPLKLNLPYFILHLKMGWPGTWGTNIRVHDLQMRDLLLAHSNIDNENKANNSSIQ